MNKKELATSILKAATKINKNSLYGVANHMVFSRNTFRSLKILKILHNLN